MMIQAFRLCECFKNVNVNVFFKLLFFCFVQEAFFQDIDLLQNHGIVCNNYTGDILVHTTHVHSDIRHKCIKMSLHVLYIYYIYADIVHVLYKYYKTCIHVC